MNICEITELSTAQYIHDRLYEYNLSKTGGIKKEIILSAAPPRYGWYVTGDPGKICGGLVYQLNANGELYIDFLWMDESLRGMGMGGKLIALAIARAKELSCSAVTLYTNSFQAPEFYKKCGFTLTGVKGEQFFYRMELGGSGSR